MSEKTIAETGRLLRRQMQSESINLITDDMIDGLINAMHDYKTALLDYQAKAKEVKKAEAKAVEGEAPLQTEATCVHCGAAYPVDDILSGKANVMYSPSRYAGKRVHDVYDGCQGWD